LETVGERKYEEILEKTQAPIKSSEPPLVMVTGDRVVCYDSFSKRYFETDSVETLRGVVNDINRQLYTDGFASVNDWYYGIGLENTENGDEYGWNIEMGVLELRLGSGLTKHNRPYVTVGFNTAMTPKHIYNRLMRNAI
jgi:hypothetical protein